MSKKSSNSLQYTVQTVQVDILRAEDITICDSNGLSDPWAEVGFVDEKLKIDKTRRGKTKTKKKTLNPEWNESFTLSRLQKDAFLMFRLWDKDRAGKDFIGQVVIPVEELQTCIGKQGTAWKDLQPRGGKHKSDQPVKGRLLFQITDIHSEHNSNNALTKIAEASLLKAVSASFGSSIASEKIKNSHEATIISSPTINNENGTLVITVKHLLFMASSDSNRCIEWSLSDFKEVSQKATYDGLLIEFSKRSDLTYKATMMLFPNYEKFYNTLKEVSTVIGYAASVPSSSSVTLIRSSEETAVLADSRSEKDTSTQIQYPEEQPAPAVLDIKDIKHNIHGAKDSDIRENSTEKVKENKPVLEETQFVVNEIPDSNKVVLKDKLNKSAVPLEAATVVIPSTKNSNSSVTGNNSQSNNNNNNNNSNAATPTTSSIIVNASGSSSNKVSKKDSKVKDFSNEYQYIHLKITREKKSDSPLSVGIVYITVIECKNLDSKDSNGLSDPFVIVKMGKKKYKTVTVKKSLNPVYNVTFKFEPVVQDCIRITVMDWDKITDDFIGQVEIEPDEFPAFGEVLDKWWKISRAKHHQDEEVQKKHKVCPGFIRLKYTYAAPVETEVGILIVTVVKCDQLKAMDANGLSDPYVKLSVGKKSFETKIIKKSLNPTFNEEFRFILQPLSKRNNMMAAVKGNTSLEDYLYVSVWDHDSSSSDDFIGERVIDLTECAGETLHDVWLQLVSSGSKLDQFLRNVQVNEIDSVKEMLEVLAVQKGLEEETLEPDTSEMVEPIDTRLQDTEPLKKRRTWDERKELFIKANKHKYQWAKANSLFIILVVLFFSSLQLAYQFIQRELIAFSFFATSIFLFFNGRLALQWVSEWKQWRRELKNALLQQQSASLTNNPFVSNNLLVTKDNSLASDGSVIISKENSLNSNGSKDKPMQS